MSPHRVNEDERERLGDSNFSLMCEQLTVVELPDGMERRSHPGQCTAQDRIVLSLSHSRLGWPWRRKVIRNEAPSGEALRSRGRLPGKDLGGYIYTRSCRRSPSGARLTCGPGCGPTARAHPS